MKASSVASITTEDVRRRGPGRRPGRCLIDSRVISIVLAGGLGARIQHLLPDTPKPLAPVAGRPFVEWILRYLRGQGVRRAVLSTGHLADKMDAFVAALAIDGLEVSCAHEGAPLGTAGGFLNALAEAQDRTSNVLACNGDSLVLESLDPLFDALDDEGTDGALLAVRVADASRFGTVDIDARGLLRGFAEKCPGAGLVNGGVYLFRRACIDRFPAKRPLSFEYDVFPALLADGARIRVVCCEAPFLDIGTEESLAQAGAFVLRNKEWFG